MPCNHTCQQGRTCDCVENELYASSTESPRIKMHRPTETQYLQPNMKQPEGEMYWFWYFVGGSLALTGLAYGIVWLADQLING